MTAIIISTLVGFITGGPVGAILGVFVGNWLNRMYVGGQGTPGFRASTHHRQKAQTAFFRATFLVMGRIAKADGRVSEYEIENARTIMHNMRLSDEQRKMAIELFNEGKNPASDIESTLLIFREVMGANTLIPMFLEIQLSAAYADGGLSPAEQSIFEQVCNILGVNRSTFTQIHDRFIAQREYYQQGSYHSRSEGRSFSSRMNLERAYKILGLSENASDTAVKKAYRKLMSEHHPDKLVANGLPEEMMEVAKKKTQEIQGAYDEIRTSRKTTRS